MVSLSSNMNKREFQREVHLQRQNALPTSTKKASYVSKKYRVIFADQSPKKTVKITQTRNSISSQVEERAVANSIGVKTESSKKFSSRRPDIRLTRSMTSEASKAAPTFNLPNLIEAYLTEINQHGDANMTIAFLVTYVVT